MYKSYKSGKSVSSPDVKAYGPYNNVLWRPAKILVNSSQETYKPYPLLQMTMPNYPKMPLPQPWGVSVIPEIKLGCPVYPHPPDLSTFTTQACLVLAKYYENHMRAADPSSQKNSLQY